MTLAQIIAFAISLCGSQTGTERYARAILATDASAEEQRALVVLAHRENWFHETSYPPFGLTYLVMHDRRFCTRRDRADATVRPGCVVLTIDDAAVRSLHALRFIRARYCVGHRWEDVLGVYHHGIGRGCISDPLAISEARAMGRAP